MVQSMVSQAETGGPEGVSRRGHRAGKVKPQTKTGDRRKKEVAARAECYANSQVCTWKRLT